MQPLQYPKLWLVVGYLLIVAAVVGSLAPDLNPSAATINDKLLHVTTYFVLMLWFAGIFKRGHYLWVAVFLFVLGLVLEVLQGQLSDRSAEKMDLVANTAGIGMGIVLAFIGVGSWCTQFEARFMTKS